MFGDTTKEDKKLARQKKKAADALVLAAEEHKMQTIWDAGYPARVKEYRSLIKIVGLTEHLVVDDNLDISVSIIESEALVDKSVFKFDKWNSVLTKTMAFWEYESLIEKVNELLLAQAHHKKFLEEVEALKASLTKEQLKMIPYFPWVL